MQATNRELRQLLHIEIFISWVTALIAGRNENQAQGGWARPLLYPFIVQS